jgi:hypothetical protein
MMMRNSTDQVDEVGVGELVGVYRHDVHKARSRSHEHARDEFGGVRVNEAVPLGADGDAAVLSRPRGDPEETLPAHGSWLRLSLLSGETVAAETTGEQRRERLRDLIDCDDAVRLHRAWVDAWVPGVYSESPYYPYTSLKYHTLLVAALLDNYAAGAAFEDLYLAVTDRRGPEVEVVPHRTVLVTSAFGLRVTPSPGDCAAVKIGRTPARSFADVWSRLPVQPLPVDAGRRWRVLDAQLRRVRSWSTALQFIEDYTREYTTATPGLTASSGGDGG